MKSRIEHYKEELILCKADEKGNLYFEDECKKSGVEIPENTKDAFFCIDCGWVISDGDTIIR